MTQIIVSMAAEAERPEMGEGSGIRRSGRDARPRDLVAHSFPSFSPFDSAQGMLLATAARSGAPLASGSTTEGTEEHGGDQNPFTTEGTEERGGGQKPFTTEGTEKHGGDKKPFTTEGTEERGGDQNPFTTEGTEEHGENLQELEPWEARELERERRVYRRRTVTMLRRYLRFSIETGRLPSVLGREFFRAKVTSYRVGTFEDRVIFVHDMETCLERLDEFSRQLIARHILQKHDQEATARLLHCTDRTVRTYVPIALDMLSEILLDLGLMERLDWGTENRCAKPCQGGREGENFVSDCEESENKF